MSPIINLNKPENTSPIKLVKRSNSNRVNEVLKIKAIPATLYENPINFHNSVKKFDSGGDLMRRIANFDFNADFSRPQDRE